MIKCVIFPKRAQKQSAVFTDAAQLTSAQHSTPHFVFLHKKKNKNKKLTHYDNWRLSFLKKTLHTLSHVY